MSDNERPIDLNTRGDGRWPKFHNPRRPLVSETVAQPYFTVLDKGNVKNPSIAIELHGEKETLVSVTNLKALDAAVTEIKKLWWHEQDIKVRKTKPGEVRSSKRGQTQIVCP